MFTWDFPILAAWLKPNPTPICMLPRAPSRSVDPLPHVCPPFLYPWAVKEHHKHQTPPQLTMHYPNVHLRFRRSSSLADPKSNASSEAWSALYIQADLCTLCTNLPERLHCHIDRSAWFIDSFCLHFRQIRLWNRQICLVKVNLPVITQSCV